jgi:hypothetical protein
MARGRELNSASRFGAYWPLLPLALAVAGALPRLAFEPERPPAPPATEARPYEPPPLFLSGAHGDGRDVELQVLRANSRARLTLDGERKLEYEVSGHAQLLADDSLAGVELELIPVAGASAVHRTLRLELRSAPGASSPIPGQHVSRCGARLFSDGQSAELELLCAWMRLPLGRVRAQLVGESALGLDTLALRPAPERAPWDGAPRGVLSLELEWSSAPRNR